ncbi:hypothetical protein C0992_002340 [Termitomyces sp. T32_za158]|nr:hypothetical protein C0992_002340 [Termitomyces sp. T32_za158]
MQEKKEKQVYVRDPSPDSLSYSDIEWLTQALVESSNLQSSPPAMEIIGASKSWSIPFDQHSSRAKGDVLSSDEETLADEDFNADHSQVSAFAEEQSLCQGLPSGALKKSKKPHAAYVVFCGRLPGIYFNWESVASQINGYSGAVQRGFPTVKAAIDAWNHALSHDLTGVTGSSTRQSAQAQVMAPEPATPRRHQAANQQSNKRQSSPKASTSKNHVSVLQDAAKAGSSCLMQSKVPVSDEESAYFAVIEGLCPGVYHRRSATARAMGRDGRPVIRMAATRAAANKLFVTAFMQRNVVRLE